jgi:sec-independent protein translocase protein TatA
MKLFAEFSIFLFAMPGMQELLLIAFILLFLFGGSKIPELLKGLGKGISEFKKGVKEDKENMDQPKS